MKTQGVMGSRKLLRTCLHARRLIPGTRDTFQADMRATCHDLLGSDLDFRLSTLCSTWTISSLGRNMGRGSHSTPSPSLRSVQVGQILSKSKCPIWKAYLHGRLAAGPPNSACDASGLFPKLENFYKGSLSVQQRASSSFHVLPRDNPFSTIFDLVPSSKTEISRLL